MQPAILSVVALMFAVGATDSARILCMVPMPSISHQLPLRRIALELVRRGHQVTFATTDPIRKNIDNYTEIDLSVTYDYWRKMVDFTTMSESSGIELLKITPTVVTGMCNIQLSLPQIKELIKSQPSFDVIIMEALFTYCCYGIVHKQGYPPLIGYVSLGAPSVLYENFGNPVNPAFSPDPMLEFTDHMSFWQRLTNTFVISVMYFIVHYVVQPMQEGTLLEHFGPNVPSVPTSEIERNFSLLLVNNHFSLNYPRPTVPSVIELAGLHIEKQRQPLPKDIKSFLDGAENGVIYFSLGTNVRGSALPEEKRRAFLEAFAQLPQRVLWKWETDSLPGQPQNVMIAKWLPQQDVLAHPNIRLFISQCGLQSMAEATYFEVPLIVIPFVGDQRHNAAKVSREGIGLWLELKDVTSISVVKAIHTVLEDQRYRENMKEFSSIFREHQETSLDRAVWWIEYVIRHKGARHLRSAALDLHWWQRLLVDVIAFVLVVTATACYVFYKAAKFVIRLLRPTQKLKSS